MVPRLGEEGPADSPFVAAALPFGVSQQIRRSQRADRRLSSLALSKAFNYLDSIPLRFTDLKEIFPWPKTCRPLSPRKERSARAQSSARKTSSMPITTKPSLI